jgi:hypothetical protein
MWRWYLRIALGVLAVLVFVTVLAGLTGGDVSVGWLAMGWLALMILVGTLLLLLSVGHHVMFSRQGAAVRSPELSGRAVIGFGVFGVGVTLALLAAFIDSPRGAVVVSVFYALAWLTMFAFRRRA